MYIYICIYICIYIIYMYIYNMYVVNIYTSVTHVLIHAYLHTSEY